MARRIVLHSPLDPVALATRLKERVPAAVDDKTVAQVIGRGSEQAMTLFYYRPRFRNDLATKLVASIEPDGGGSRIEGTIGAPTAGMVFLGCWMVFVTLFLLGPLALWLGGAPLLVVGPMLGIAGGMLAFGLLFGWLALHHGKRDAAAIRTFLAETVDAR